MDRNEENISTALNQQHSQLSHETNNEIPLKPVAAESPKEISEPANVAAAKDSMEISPSKEITESTEIIDSKPAENPSAASDLPPKTDNYHRTDNAGFAPVKAAFVVPMAERKAVVQLAEGKGMNKKRDFSFMNNTGEYPLCQRTARGEPCTVDGCRRQHDVKAYLATKKEPLGDQCPVFMEYGKCPYGIMCAFYRHHTADDGQPLPVQADDQQQPASVVAEPCNKLSRDVQIAIRKRTYIFDQRRSAANQPAVVESSVVETTEPTTTIAAVDAAVEESVASVVADEPTAAESRQRRTVDFRGKSYLAPLTTVGNLPFRRVCKDMGVDITCGEMAMAEDLLKCSPSEWALLRRHPSEDIFGVQICGSNPDMMTRAVHLLNNEISADFIDVNMGCPIDLVFKRGNGSGMFNRPRKMEAVIQQICNVSRIPITTKFRTGIMNGKNIAHDYIPKFKEFGVAACTLHGRSRQQRYQKLADWDYITECSKVAKDCGIQLLGNGDIMSYEEYDEYLNRGIDGCMVGRAALMKPWIFTELKENRHWDISATERLDLMKQFCNYGLIHWGSDESGINRTRRFLLEWQSFHCRYIPVGLLEVLPQKMNERPPPYYGRSDLETLLASDNAKDWIKLSEMLLGKIPESFKFVPKHKSNAYEVMETSG